MAFVSPDLAESVTLSGETVSDGGKSTEGSLNDNNTGTSASAELRQGMGGYKITHDLGFPVASLDTISIRIFDGTFMTGGDVVFYPYSSGDSDVVTGNEVQVTIVDDAAYQEHDISAMIGDFGDVGTNQISIRLVADDAGSLRGRLNEIQIEFAGVADPAITDVDIDEDIDDKQTGVVITGTDFEATQGTGKVEISDNATYGSGNVVLQDETAWGATSITITVALGAMVPGLIRYVWVTNNSSNRNAVGFPIRLRRAQAFSMSASANIATSGEDTTQRLATPSGKVGGDFTAGRIQDDENPGDAVSDGLDAFFEHEWCLTAKTDANNVQYQFRVLVGGALPDALPVDPRWTVGTAAGGIELFRRRLEYM